MRKFIDFVRGLSLAACLWPAGSALAADWETALSRLQLDTPHGQLRVSESDYIYEARLLLDGVAIEPAVTGLLNIPHAYSTSSYHVALISVSDGNPDCPISYHWIKLDRDGYALSPSFGSCSEFIRVSADNSAFTLETPSMRDPGALDIYRYDGKTIRQKSIRLARK